MLTDVIIPQVQSILQAVVPAGTNVHPYIRIAADDSAFKALFFDAEMQRIHGYTITRESTGVEEIDIGAAKDLHSIIIRGYMGAKDDDATETLFQAEIETVRTAFMAKRELQDVNGVRKVFWSERIVVRQFAYSMFSGVLCHYAELLLTVKDYPIS